MTAFDEWFKAHYIKHGFITSEKEAREIFNAGMTRAAEICEQQADAAQERDSGKWPELKMDAESGARTCQYSILAARDGK